MILNGSESIDQSAAQNTVHYTANSEMTSTLDGNTEVLLDPARSAASRPAV